MLDQPDMDFIAKLFQSLQAEMHQGFADVNERIDQTNARLDQTNARLDRIGGLVNGGARAIAKMIEWSEKTDVTSAGILADLAELKERVRRLEAKP